MKNFNQLDSYCVLLSDYVCFYTEHVINSKDETLFEIDKINLGKEFKRFNDCLPTTSYHQDNEVIRKLDLKITPEISRLCFKYFIEKLLLEHSFCVFTYGGEDIPHINIHQGNVANILDDYSEFLLNVGGLKLGFIESTVEMFLDMLNRDGVINNIIHKLKSIIYKYPTKLLYPIKWLNWNNKNELELVMAIAQPYSKFYNTLPLDKLSDFDFGIMKNGRLLSDKISNKEFNQW